MPVIEVSLSRLKARGRNKVTEEEILEALPFVGLDIEDKNEDTVTVEYSPNRPDFCSEAGIARSLLGLLGIERGLPLYNFPKGSIKISVEGREIQSVRAYIFSCYVSLHVTEEVIKQLIVMQEDLHNGLGRHRAKVAIGIHNAEMVRTPIKYFATADDTFSFVPLGSRNKMPIREIVQKTEQGKLYGKILSSGLFPLLIDSSGNTLSMPPVINGELTRLKQGVRSIFVDVTATEKLAGEATIAIIAAMLSDIGGKVESVTIQRGDGSNELTPNMMPETMKFDLNLTNETLGLDLSYREAKDALEKSRIELLSKDQARIPRFRSDIIHPIDLAEEVELGYGVSKLRPQKSKSFLTGSVTDKTKRLRKLVDILVGLDLTQIESLSLTSRPEVALDPIQNFKVENPKSQNYEYLRSQALPSLLEVLGQSTHEEYPQRVFEQVAIFRKHEGSDIQVVEEEHVAAAIADSRSNYTTVRSLLDAFLRLGTEPDSQVVLQPSAETGSIFAKGRTARVYLTKQKLDMGTIGEVSPFVLESLGVRVPIAAFELNLEPILKS